MPRGASTIARPGRNGSLKRGASPEAVRVMTQGGDSSALSALYMLRQFAMLRTSSQLYKIAGGMDRLPQAMAAALGDVVRLRGGGRQNLARGRVDRDRVRNARPHRAARGEPRGARDPAVHAAADRVSTARCRPPRKRRSARWRTIRACGSCCSRAIASGTGPASTDRRGRRARRSGTPPMIGRARRAGCSARPRAARSAARSWT